jgi:hypothetical protein
MVEQVKDLIIEPFKSRKREFRSDKGKKHSYPKQRKSPLNSSKTVKDTNLALNVEKSRVLVMSRKYKGSPSMREYWREQKRRQRAKEKVEK